MSLDAMASARWRVTFSTASPWPMAGAYTSTRVRALAPVAHGTALLAISHAPTPHATASTTSTATASAHWPAVSDHWPETRYMSAKIWKGCPAWGAHEGERREDQGHRDDDRQFDLAAGRTCAQILHSVRLQFRIDVGQDSFLLSSMTAEPMEAVPPSMRQGLRHG